MTSAQPETVTAAGSTTALTVVEDAPAPTLRFTFTAGNGVLPNAIQTFTLKVIAIEIITKATPGLSYSATLKELGGCRPSGEPPPVCPPG